MADHRPLKYNHPVYRFFPHKTKGEGFFLAALRKADGEAEEIRFKNKNKKEKGKTAPAIPKAVKSFLSDTSSFSPEWSGSILRMLPESVRGAYPLLREHLRILSAGICIGEAKGKDFIPAEELALSTALRPDAFPVADLDWDDAIRYLKKEALLLPAGTEKGYVLVRHKNFPLGLRQTSRQPRQQPLPAGMAHPHGVCTGTGEDVRIMLHNIIKKIVIQEVHPNNKQ